MSATTMVKVFQLIVEMTIMVLMILIPTNRGDDNNGVDDYDNKYVCVP